MTDFRTYQFDAVAGMVNYYTWIAEHFAPYLGSHCVEFGAGIGTLAGHILPRVDKLDLVEYVSVFADKLQTRFDKEDRVRIHTRGVETCQDDFQKGSIDSAIMVNVLEHIEDDTTTLIDIAEILKPGGHILLFVPAMQFLFSELDRREGHFRRYHLDALCQKVSASGYDIVDARYSDILGVLPWWFLNTLCGLTDINPTLARIYDQVGVPVTRGLENFVRPPFGKSLFLIAAKSG